MTKPFFPSPSISGRLLYEYECCGGTTIAGTVRSTFVHIPLTLRSQLLCAGYICTSPSSKRHLPHSLIALGLLRLRQQLAVRHYEIEVTCGTTAEVFECWSLDSRRSYCSLLPQRLALFSTALSPSARFRSSHECRTILVHYDLPSKHYCRYAFARLKLEESWHHLQTEISYLILSNL